MDELRFDETFSTVTLPMAQGSIWRVDFDSEDAVDGVVFNTFEFGRGGGGGGGQ